MMGHQSFETGREVNALTKVIFTDTKRPNLFTMGGKELRELCAGPGRLALTKAAKAEQARRKANVLAKKASA
jgi:hypothetical protein